MDSDTDMAAAADSSQVELDRREEGIGGTLAHVVVVAVAGSVVVAAVAAADKFDVVAAAVDNESGTMLVVRFPVAAAEAAIRPIHHFPTGHD